MRTIIGNECQPLCVFILFVFYDAVLRQEKQMGRIKLETGNKRKERKNRKYVESDEYKNGKDNFEYYERKKGSIRNGKFWKKIKKARKI